MDTTAEMQTEVKPRDTWQKKQRATFAANLNRRRKELHLNQSDISRAVSEDDNHIDSRGYNHPKRKSLISEYCMGNTLPNLDTMAKIAVVLKTTPEALLRGSGVSVPTSEKIDTRERFSFEWDGDTARIDLQAVFPAAVGREIAALVTKHLEIKGSVA